MAWFDKITEAVENLALGSAKKKREAKEAEDAQKAEEEKKKKKARSFIRGQGQMSEAEWEELDKASKGK